MTNWKSWLWPGVIVVLILTLLAGWITGPNVETELTGRANSAFSENGQSWASAKLDGRDLTLSGTAPSEAAIDAAEKLAKNAYDVRIVNNLTQLLAAQSPYKLNATLDAETLTLSGFVADGTRKSDIIAAAESALPNAAVVDQLKLARGQPENYIQANKFGLSQLTKFGAGHYTLNDTNYSVDGTAKTSGEYETAISELAGGLPGNFRIANQAIKAPLTSPYEWKSQLARDTVTLTGFIPDIASQKTLLGQVKKSNPDNTISNQMTFASGEPDGFTNATQFGLSQLPKLIGGEVSLSDTELSVTGKAKTLADYNAVIDDLRNNVPSGFTIAKQKISAPTAEPYLWGAKLVDDQISLSGFVPDEGIREKIVESATNNNPGKNIKDSMKIASGAPEGFEKTTTLGVSVLSKFDNGEISLRDKELSVTGQAISPEKYGEALALLGSNSSSRIKNVKQDISLPAAKPYLWAANLANDRISLSGFVPDDATRAKIVASVAGNNPGKAVEDSMKLASGAPESYDIATDFALSVLPKLATGEVSLSDKNYSVTGVAGSVSAFDDISTLLDNKLPAGYTIATRQITHTTVSPYLWSAVKTIKGIMLTGYAPGTKSMVDIVGYATRKNPGSNIINNLKLANGAPEGYSSSTVFTQDIFAKLSNGSAKFVDGSLTISGQASSVQNYYDAIQMDVPADINLVKLNISPAKVSPYELHITKNDKEINLSGFIPGENSRSVILAEAGNLLRSLKINDSMKVATGPPAGIDWDKAAKFGLAQLGQLEKGKIDMRDTAFSIRGVAEDLGGYKQVRAALKSGIAGGMNLAMQDVKPPFKSPYVWNAARNGMQVILDGFVPSMDIAAKNVGTVKDNLGQNAEIENKLSPGSGAPNGFSNVTTLGINLIGRLENSRAFILNNSLAINGEALSEQAKTAITNQLRGSLPDNFVGKTNITVRKAKQSEVVKPDVCQALLNSLQSDNTIHFDFAKYEIRQESFGLLDRLVFTANRCPDSNISIEGHTDHIGSHRYNQGLSENRALATVKYLVENGIAQSRIRSSGFGETRLLVDDGTAEGDAKNRRIEFRVLN